MKYILIALLALFLTGYALSFTVEAQSPVVTSTLESPVAPPDFPSELPETATDALPYIREWLLFFASSITTYLVAGVKNKVPWLGGQEWFLKIFTEFVTAVLASTVAFLLGNVAVFLGFLDASGLWQVIVFSYPAAVGIYHTKKFSSKLAR